jgi:hypothetical protein
MTQQQMDDALKSLDAALKAMTPEELEEYFPEDKRPKGWLSIEEHLPYCDAADFVNQGYSTVIVKGSDGNEFESRVTDHNIWYHVAKQEGITHWYNE